MSVVVGIAFVGMSMFAAYLWRNYLASFAEICFGLSTLPPNSLNSQASSLGEVAIDPSSRLRPSERRPSLFQPVGLS